MRIAGLEEMSRRRRNVFIALMGLFTLLTIAQAVMRRSDASYLLATVVGVRALAVVIESWATSRRDLGRETSFVVFDLVPTALMLTAIGVWARAYGWFSLILAAAILVFTWLSYVRRQYANERPQ